MPREFANDVSSGEAGAGPPRIVLVELNARDDRIVFTRSDRKQATFPAELSPQLREGPVASVQFAPGWPVALLTTARDETVFFELPEHVGSAQQDGRTVVYLDQNQWSAIARRRRLQESSGVQDATVDTLTRLVVEQKIILPASAAHHHETTKWHDDDRRYQLGLTILQLSRGWQMRDPLRVRANELYNEFCTAVNGFAMQRLEAVFTLDPEALFGQAREHQEEEETDDGLPSDAAFAAQALTRASVSASILLDPDVIERGPETGWAEAQQTFGDGLHRDTRDSQQRRNLIDDWYLADISRDVAREASAAGMNDSMIANWRRDSSRNRISALPSVGLFREMMRYRHANPGTRWHDNDLTDIFYLACGGAYADMVVCERHMAAPLRQGLRTLGLRAHVFTKLDDLAPALEETR